MSEERKNNLKSSPQNPRAAGRPNSGREGATTSVYADRETLALWKLCASKTGKSKTLVLEEAMRDYAKKHEIKEQLVA